MVQDPPRRGVPLWLTPVLRLLVVAALLAVGVGGVWLVTDAAAPHASPTTTDVPALQVKPADVEPGTAAPVANTIAGGEAVGARPGPGASGTNRGPTPLTAWAGRLASAVDVPARALAAYGNAELAMREYRPGCRLSWATLAGIGRIESDHGRYGNAVLGSDGRPSVPIIGVPLNGSAGVKAIRDTDGGQLDGDPMHDRAVGPMQFIPSTWARYASDGDGDGLADPQQIDDAALSAARYLCAGGRDMSGAEGWWRGVLSYNHSVQYAQQVFGLADHYARQARALGG